MHRHMESDDYLFDMKERAIKQWEHCGLDVEDNDTEDYVNICG